MKVLFISRTYPPIVGGMEKVSYHIIKSISKIKGVESKAIVNTKGKKYLLFFLAALIPEIIKTVPKYEIVHLSDVVLAPVGEIIKIVYPRIKVVATIHGLDITYGEKNFIYRKINIKALEKLDRLFAVSNETKQSAIKAGIKREKISVITNGIDPFEFCDDSVKKEQLLDLITKKTRTENFWKKNKDKLKNKVFLLTLGRLCKRKGFVWFIKNVLSNLDKKAIYLIAGLGKERKIIEKVCEDKGVRNKVFFLGYVTDEEKKVLFNTVDIFVQPNIKVSGDMEGLGVTALEASSCARPVIASNLEGIKDAISQKENGILIEPLDDEKYIKVLNRFIDDKNLRESFGLKGKYYTNKKYDWKKVAEIYYNEFEQVLNNKKSVK